MKIQIRNFKAVILAGFFLAISTLSFGQNPPPHPSWMDSYQANGKCWCDSTFDHNIGNKTVKINGTNYRIQDVCDELKKHPGHRNRQGNDPIYNDIQCGNGPANDHKDFRDEDWCPGRIDIGTAGCFNKGPKWDMNWLSSRPRFGGGGNGGGNNANIVTMRKKTAMNYALDGNNGGANGQNIYLWGYNPDNVNQQWVEIDRGGGYYSYQKRNTNYCIDGNNGGANGQNVYLWSCNSNNQNQHWRKVKLPNGTYRLEKRNAGNYSIDGNNGSANGQNTYIWSSNNNNGNQQWVLTVVGSTKQ